MRTSIIPALPAREGRRCLQGKGASLGVLHTSYLDKLEHSSGEGRLLWWGKLSLA